MNAAMSNATSNDCSQTACVVSTYDNSSGKYVEDTVMSKDRDGNDISYSENIWARNRQKYYLNFPNFGVWYERSPYSKVDYRFSIYCNRYYSNNYG